jgi:prevent-host-death family protein
MARRIRKSDVKQVPLSEIKDDLSRYLREAETREIVITRHGKPAGVLIGFESEEDWFEYRLENDPRFLHRIEQALACRAWSQVGRHRTGMMTV